MLQAFYSSQLRDQNQYYVNTSKLMTDKADPTFLVATAVG